MVSNAARRYAKAFLHIAIEQDSLDQTIEDILFIRNTIDASRDLDLFLKNPIIKPGMKVKALDEIFGDGIQTLTGQFLQLLVRKGREDLLGQITESFVRFYNEHAGIIDVSVSSAMPLSDQQQKDLKEALESSTQKKVELTYSVNSGLMGGLAVRIDDTVIDGTVKNKLSQLKTLFSEAPAGQDAVSG